MASSKYKSSVGTGRRDRPKLATTIAAETDDALRAHSAKTGVPISKIVDRAVAMYLKTVRR